MQLHDDIGLGSLELGEQELAEQGVVPVPPTSTVERDEEGARRIELAKLFLRI